MLRKIHGTNFFLIKLLDRTDIKYQNGPVLLPAQVFYFNGQALYIPTYIHTIHALSPKRGSRGISDIPPRHPRLTKIS
jgi:hypothetical protein